jgi:spore germination protein GerM
LRIDSFMKNSAKERVKNSWRFIILPLVIIFLVVIVAAWFWFGLREQDVSGPPVAWEKVLPIQEKRNVTLYFGDARSMRLITEQRAIPFMDGPVELAIELINALLDGPRNGAAPTLPSQTRLKALYITVDNTAVVDFSRELTSNHPGGVNAEMLTIFSVVKTLTRNIPQIKKVKLLVEGAEIETLSGHVDCLRPFSIAPSWIEGPS